MDWDSSQDTVGSRVGVAVGFVLQNTCNPSKFGAQDPIFGGSRVHNITNTIPDGFGTIGSAQ